MRNRDNTPVDKNSVALPARFSALFNAENHKFWTAAHYVSLSLLALVFIKLGSRQWFFYDEWSMLLDENQWKVFEPHNGHLSFALVISFSITRAVFGLGSYWPFFVLVLLAHLGAVHFLWRILKRQQTQSVVVLLLPLLFGLLGVGAENTFWAFQVAFIAPIPLGFAALLIADRGALNWRRVIALTLLLGLALSFASTAIPFIAATLSLVVARSGWKPTAIIATVIGIPYFIWRVLSRASASTTGFEAHTPHQLFVEVPNYVLHSFVDSLSKAAPVEVVSGALVCVGGIFALWHGSHIKFSDWPIRYFLAAGAVFFTILTAISRVGYGIDGASSGRYVYILAAMTLPAIGYSLSKFSARNPFALLATLTGIGVVGMFNGTILVENSRNQAAIEQFTKLEIAAVATMMDQTDVDDSAQPSPVLAPQITVGDVRRLIPLMNLDTETIDPGALLSVETAVFISSKPSSQQASCTSNLTSDISFVSGIHREVILVSDTIQTVDITTSRNGVTSAYTRIQLAPGAQTIQGLPEAAVSLHADSAVFCSEAGTK